MHQSTRKEFDRNSHQALSLATLCLSESQVSPTNNVIRGSSCASGTKGIPVLFEPETQDPHCDEFYLKITKRKLQTTYYTN